MTHLNSFVAAFVLLASLGVPNRTHAHSEWEPVSETPALEAVAVLHASKGSAIVGKVELRPAGDALMVRAELGGLVPGAKYRLQIHRFGDCSAVRATSAGDPFGPAEQLIEFRAGDDGWVDLAFSHRGHTLDRSPESVLGRSVVVHGEREREGCGTIGVAMRREDKPPVPAGVD